MKGSKLPPPIYPSPAENPDCKCIYPMQQLLCPTGHMTECHFPHPCDIAACSHLERYFVSPERIAQLRADFYAAFYAAHPHRKRQIARVLQDVETLEGTA